MCNLFGVNYTFLPLSLNINSELVVPSNFDKTFWTPLNEKKIDIINFKVANSKWSSPLDIIKEKNESIVIYGEHQKNTDIIVLGEKTFIKKNEIKHVWFSKENIE